LLSGADAAVCTV